MPFVPRSAEEIAQSMLAKILARSPLTDVNEGSVVWTLCRTHGEEIADAEQRLWQVRQAFSLVNPGVSQADLDERLAEFPPGAVSRVPYSAASGAVMTISRQQAGTQQVLPAGVTFQRFDANLLYRTVQPFTFNIGVTTLTDVFVVCTSTGTQGNCGAGTITKSVGAPSWLLSAVNTKPLTNGADAESDDAVKQRALLWLAGLPRAQKQALEFLALSYVAGDGTRAKFAKVFEDSANPGYAELIVDDGSGFGTLKQAAGNFPQFTIPVPPQGQTVFYHPGPAAEPFSAFYLQRGQALIQLLPGQFKHLQERGIVEVPAGQSWSAQSGDYWACPPYDQFVGFIAELQRQVEGDANDPVNTPGWRAAGVRVVVKPPEVFKASMAIHVVPQDYVDLADLQSRVLDYVIAYCETLGPGDPLFVAQLTASVLQDPDVLNFRVYDPGSSPASPKQDVYVTPKQVIRTDLAHLSFLGGA